MKEEDSKKEEKKRKNVAVTISSNTLFNFMKEYQFLEQALEKGLWPRYSVEPNWEGKHFAIPMLCFCDIPLSHIKNHLCEYGEYGIGVTKDFAKKHSITPVLYVASGSTMMNKIRYYIRTFEHPTENEKMDYLEYLLYYIKKVNGKNCEQKNCKFYNEREWRFIPKISHNVHLNIFKSIEKAKEQIASLSHHTEEERISLKPDDIAYIFVSTDSDKKKLIKKLAKIYQSEGVADIMKTKILTCKQIREDF